MGFQLETNLSAIAVFLQGILSFLSPCVLPLLPLYLGYLSGGATALAEDGRPAAKGRVLLNTLFFVMGIGFTFFLLALGASALGQFFSRYHVWFSRIGGAVVVLFGLYQLSGFQLPFLSAERRLSLKTERLGSGPLTALLLGFTFSFSWTPCIGPTLTSVLLMATGSGSSSLAFLYIGIYTAGFCIPFLLVGFFTSSLLTFFKKNRSLVRYTVKIGAVLMIAIGLSMMTGWMNGLSSSLAGSASGNTPAPQETEAETVPGAEIEDVPETSGAKTSAAETSVENPQDSQPSETSQEEQELPDAPEFTLTDQNGVSHTFSDYKGKTVFLNFWATWCPPCKSELGSIQELYEDWGENSGDLIILTAVRPNDGQEGDIDYIQDFLEDNGYTFPVLMDETGILFYQYGITAFPTTFMITTEGKVYGYVPGAMTRELMDMIIEQTMEGG